MYCNGVENMVVRGMNGRVLMQQGIVTWMYCSGVENMDVRGMIGRVLVQQKMVT